MQTANGLHAGLTERILGCAIEVHRHLGPGLPEAVCEEALCLELAAEGIPFQRQIGIPVHYKEHLIGEYRPDLVVDDKVIVEVKSIERFAPVHRAQMLSYLRIRGLRVGLVLNFNSPVMKDGIHRVAL